MALVADYCDSVPADAMWTSVLDGGFVFGQDASQYDGAAYKHPCEYGHYNQSGIHSYVLSQDPECSSHQASFLLPRLKRSPELQITRSSRKHSPLTSCSAREAEFSRQENDFSDANVKTEAWGFSETQSGPSRPDDDSPEERNEENYVTDPDFGPYLEMRNIPQRRCSDPESNTYKKRKLNRLTPEQVLRLKETFESNPKLNQARRIQLAQQLNLNPRQIEVWFQNKRAKLKTKNTETQFSQLKRAYDEQCKSIQKLEKVNAEMQKQMAFLSERNSSLAQLGSSLFQDGDDHPIRDANGNFDTTDLIIAKSDGTLIKISPSMVELLGYSEEELLNMRIQSVLYSPAITTDVFEAILSGQLVTAVLKEKFRAKDGREVIGQWKVYGVRNSYGEMYLVSYLRRLSSTHFLNQSLSHSVDSSSSGDDSDSRSRDS